MKGRILAAVVCALLLFPAVSSADNLARDYIPAPPGTLATLLYYSHVNADSLYSNGQRTANIDLTENVGLFRPVYYTTLGPITIDPQFILPFVDIDFKNNDLTSNNGVSNSGIGDPMVFATFWFLNDPDSKTWLGFTPFFFLPIGEYKESKYPFNPGANVWRFREELGFVKGFELMPGHSIYFELQVGGDFQTDNDDTPAGKVSTDPIFNFEHHTSYDVTKNFWISGDYYYHWGGETETNGVSDHNIQRSHTVGGTAAYNISPEYQLLFQYKDDIYVSQGARTQTATVRFLYATDFSALVDKLK